MVRIFVNNEPAENAPLRHGEENVLRAEALRPICLRFLAPAGDVLFARDLPVGISEVSLGPLLAPPVLRYRAGIVEWRGYRLQVIREGGEEMRFAQSDGAVSATWKFREPTKRTTMSRLAMECSVWQQFHLETAFAVPIRMRLSEDALAGNWDETRLILMNPSSADVPRGWSFVVVVEDAGRNVLCRSEQMSSEVLAEPLSYDFGAKALGEGSYFIRLEFHQGGAVYRDGPELTFHKKAREGECCANPYTQRFLSMRDAETVLDVADINDALAEARGPDLDSLTRMEEWKRTRRMVTKPVSFDRPSALFIACGNAGCAFSINGSEPKVILPNVRYCAAILPVGRFTLGFHSLFSLKNTVSHVQRLSVVALEDMPDKPEKRAGVPLVGISDWAEYFSDESLPQKGQLGKIIEGQWDLGFSEIGWAVARSWVEYGSALPQTSRWPVVPLEVAVQRDPRAYNYVGRTTMTNMTCPLREASQRANDLGIDFTAWMALNTHYYAEAIGGICCSKWFQEHPRFHQWRKGAAKSFPGELCYYFAEVRQERIAILDEIAGLDVSRFLLDATRQPRVVLYHPEMMAEYRALTGIDPASIDAANGELYEHWIQWRSGFFTQFLRDLRGQLSAHYPERKFLIALRIPQCDLLMNLASGFDVLTWYREGLIDRLYLNPLEIYNGGLREITPYIEAGRAAGVEVYGAIGQTWTWGGGATVALRRAASLIEAGVDGIDFFESELLSRGHPLHELVSKLSDLESISSLLENTNLPACHPFDNDSAMLGYDNHSRWTGLGWRREGFAENCL